MSEFSARRTSRSSEWSYVLLTVAAFVFTPELRRLIDWRGSYDPLNTFAALPLLMLCPIAIFVFRRRERLRSRAFAFVTIAYLAGFVYATFIAAAYGSVSEAVYDIAQFCLPITVGAWLLTRPESMSEAYARFARALLIFGAIAATYGVFQWVVAPPWDTAWLQNIQDADAFGSPEPFGMRAFGTLNGPGTFALFLGAVVIMNLPYLRVRSAWNMYALLIITVGILLSFVRAAWLAEFFGIIIFLCFTPRRKTALLTLGSVVAVCTIGVIAVVVALPNARTGDQIISRFATLTDVQDDGSALERQNTALVTIGLSLEQPAGHGLGLTGGSAKLAVSGSHMFRGGPTGAIDNGFVSRFFEMGVPGFGAFMIACCASIVFLAGAYRRFKQGRDENALRIVSSCIATVSVIFAVNLLGDDQQGILAVIFFVAIALPLVQLNAQTNARELQPITVGSRLAGYRRSTSQ